MSPHRTATIVFTVATLAVWPCAGVTGAGEETGPRLRATLTQSIGFGVMFSQGPRITLYEDGTIIFAKKQTGGMCYFKGQLPKHQLADLDKVLAPPNPFYELEEEISLAPDTHDLPHMSITLHFADKTKTVYVYGYSIKPYRGPSAYVARGNKPDPFPESFDQVARTLLKLDPDNARPWQPEFVELRLARYGFSDRVPPHAWPQEWPKPGSPTSERIDHNVDSIIITGDQLSRFKRLADQTSFFTIDGIEYCVYWWTPLFPGTERSMRYHRADAQQEK